MLSWSAKWLNNPNMMSDVLTPEEALREDDLRITKSMWHLFNEADIIIAQRSEERFVHPGLTAGFL